MRKTWFLLVMLMVLGTRLAYGQPAAAATSAQPHPAALPEGVVALAEVGDLVSCDEKVRQLALAVDPTFAVESFVGAVPLELMMTMDPATVDLTKPVQVVVLEPPLHDKPIFVFSATDAARYLDSISDRYAKARDEGELHVYVRVREGAAGPLEGEGRVLAIAAVGNRVAMGRDVNVLKKVLALMKDAGFATERAFPDSDAGVTVRLRRLLEGLSATGKNPFNALRGVLAMLAARGGPGGGPAGVDQQAVLMGYVDAIERLSMQLDVLTVALKADGEAISGHVVVQPVAGGGLAGYLAQMPRSELELLKYLPADSMLLVAAKVGDMTPMAGWVEQFLGALVPGPDKSAVTEMASLFREYAACMEGEMAFSISQSAEGPLLAVSAAKVKGVDSMRRLMDSMPDRMARMSGAMPGMGMKTTLTRTPGAIEHNGHLITEWRYTYEFTPAPGPQGEQIAAMQRKAVAVFWGEDFRAYSTFVGNHHVQVQGPGSLDVLKRILDGQARTAAGSEELAAALQGMPGSPAAAGYLALDRCLDFGLYMVSQMMGNMGQTAPPAVFPKYGPPVGFGAWVREDGALEKRFRVPVETVRSMVQRVQQMTGQPPEPFMMP